MCPLSTSQLYILNLGTVQYASSSVSGGSRGISCVHEEASSCWLTASLTLVSGLRFDTNCHVGTVCFLANHYITKFCLRHTKMNETKGKIFGSN